MANLTFVRRPLFVGFISAFLGIVILARLTHDKYQAAVTAAREQALRQHLFLLRDAIERYRADTGKCPDSFRTLEERDYIRAVPVDPFMESSKTWNYTQPKCVVKSASLDRARDGSRYAAW
jgi:general secretion pathway protein G